jgi:hypothetical protein
MDKLETQVIRGQRASELLSDPLMIEARTHIDAELWRLFRAAVPTDTDALQQIKAMEYMHGKYLAFLKSAVNDGKMATMEIESKKKSVLDHFRSKR